MSKTPNYDLKVKQILDELEPGERVCELTGETWVMNEEEIGWYRKFNVPPGPYSPKGKLLLLSSFYLVYQWWWNKDAETGEPVLTSIHPASGVKVLPDKKWFDRDYVDRGRDVNISAPFFEQWRELQLDVPMLASRNNVEPENSIAQFSMGDKNSYFVGASTSKNCLYMNDSQEAESSMDSMAAISITDCYHVSHSSRLHRCKLVCESYDCVDSSFLFDCRNCEFCFGASNKRNKKYLFWNEQLSKEEWEKRVSEVDLGSYIMLEKTREKFYAMIREAVWPENFNIQTTDSTGEYLIKCSDNVRCSYGRDGHHNYYCYGLWNGAEGNAFSTVVPGTDSYQAGPITNSSGIKFSAMLVRCDDVEYSFGCHECTHCFGCVGLRYKQFHIFNKSYSEEEYWKKVDELKCAMLERGEYGRPFPAKYSTSYYPEGGPMLYFGTRLEDWDMIGMPRFEIDADGAFGVVRVEGKEMVRPEEIPDHIDEIDDSWIGRVILDTEINRPFTYLKPELAFYRKHRLAVPRKHFTSRVGNLMRSMNMGLFEETKCHVCSKDLLVANNNTFENRKMHCMECYLKHLETNG